MLKTAISNGNDHGKTAKERLVNPVKYTRHLAHFTCIVRKSGDKFLLPLKGICIDETIYPTNRNRDTTARVIVKVQL